MPIQSPDTVVLFLLLIKIIGFYYYISALSFRLRRIFCGSCISITPEKFPVCHLTHSEILHLQYSRLVAMQINFFFIFLDTLKNFPVNRCSSSKLFIVEFSGNLCIRNFFLFIGTSSGAGTLCFRVADICLPIRIPPDIRQRQPSPKRMNEKNFPCLMHLFRIIYFNSSKYSSVCFIITYPSFFAQHGHFLHIMFLTV